MTVKRKVTTMATENSILLTPNSALQAGGGDVGAATIKNTINYEAVP